LVYVIVVGDGAVATQFIDVSLTAANVAVSAGSIVMILEVVIVRLQLSVNVHVSVYVPPHAVCEPVITEVTLPLIKQVPLALLV
jgi:hypothetical protein